MDEAEGSELELRRFADERFVDVEVLGAGGSGTVYRAWDQQLEREVAIKVSRYGDLLEELGLEELDELGIREGLARYIDRAELDRTQRYTLLREARLLARVSHPNVVTVLEIGLLEDDALAVVMPLLARGSLEQQTFDGPWEDVLDIALQIGRGLMAIHDVGLLHRDLKPGNVLFDAHGSPQISDLGLACFMEDEDALAEWPGTPRYMAPEVFHQRGQDQRADIYAYCVIVFEMFYGCFPFAGPGTTGELVRVIRPGGMSTTVHAILERGLARDPGSRWRDMRQLLAALEAAAAAPQRRRPRRSLIAAVALGCSFVAGLFAAARSVQADECEEVVAELEQLWNEERAAEIRGALGTRKGSDALGSWASRWRSARALECEAAKRAERPTTVSPCMESIRAHFGAVVSTLRAPHLREGLYLSSVITELPPPEHCLSSPADGEFGSVGLLRLRELDVELATLIAVKDHELARERLAQYIARARELGSRYDIARASLWRGLLEGAEDDLRDAYREAAVLGAGLFEAEAALALAEVALVRGDLHRAEDYAQVAELEFRRVRPDRVAEALRLRGLALVSHEEPSLQVAGLDLLAEATEKTRAQYRSYGGSPEPLSVALEVFGRGLYQAGDYPSAIATIEHSLALHLDAFTGSTDRARELQHQLFLAQLGAGLERDAEQTMLTVIMPLLEFGDHHRYVEELRWYVSEAMAHDAYWAEEWSRQLARSSSRQQ